MSKEKLKLEEIANYIPFGLKGDFNVRHVQPTAPDEIREKELTADNVRFFITYCKPKLMPLSKCYINVTSGKVMEMLNCNLKSVHEIWDLATGDIELNDIRYSTFIVCMKNHIDIYKLIDKDLAIIKD